jgi:murein DD-endopeptidase MepM/ murein hydrolase activator NlpD
MRIVGNLGRRLRLVTAMLLVIGAASAVVPGAVSAQSESPADKAAREIQEARDQANAAADAYFKAESVLEQLEDDLAGLVIEEAQLQVTVDELRAQVEVVALGRYIASGTEGIPLLTDVSEPQDQIQAEVFIDVLTNSGADTLDQYEAAEQALGDKQDEVAERQDEVEDQREQFADLEEAALSEVERLREIEQERLKDEAVQKALEARIAAERAELEERARLDAEAAARAQPNPGLVVPPSTEPPPETTTTTIDPNAPVPTDANGDPVPVTQPPPTDPPVTNPPETTIPENTGGSGGTSGGRTGGGGGGNGPGAINTGGTYVDQIMCPMPGGAYGDTWGAARSGGRRHEGVDMIAPRGLPIYAVIGGVVTFKSNRLGGNAVSLVGDNGNRYYYAHLDSYVGGSRRVFQGEVIGYNGDSGNARFSTPHLHFQVHPGGGRAVNPYPTVRAAGC